MKIIVASKNPVKLNAAQQGFETYFLDVEVAGITVPSGVGDQPMSDAETLQGAIARVNNAHKLSPDADYWIGIEGGLEINDEGAEAFAWIVIHNNERQGRARTTSFLLPHRIVELIHEGYELGEANDIFFHKENSKQKGGAVGILTNNKISRTELYRQAVQLALIPLVNSRLY